MPRRKATSVLLLDVNGHSEQPTEWTEFDRNLSLNENEAGTVVGLNATDPDAGAVLTYHLVSGVGDETIPLLWRPTHAPGAVTFDYESNASSYAIRVQVKDEHNARVEPSRSTWCVNEGTPNNPPRD